MIARYVGFCGALFFISIASAKDQIFMRDGSTIEATVRGFENGAFILRTVDGKEAKIRVTKVKSIKFNRVEPATPWVAVGNGLGHASRARTDAREWFISISFRWIVKLYAAEKDDE